jgi:hypothetical protein
MRLSLPPSTLNTDLYICNTDTVWRLPRTLTGDLTNPIFGGTLIVQRWRGMYTDKEEMLNLSSLMHNATFDCCSLYLP